MLEGYSEFRSPGTTPITSQPWGEHPTIPYDKLDREAWLAYVKQAKDKPVDPDLTVTNEGEADGNQETS